MGREQKRGKMGVGRESGIMEENALGGKGGQAGCLRSHQWCYSHLTLISPEQRATHTKAWGWGLGEQEGGAASWAARSRCTPTACFICRDPTRGSPALAPSCRVPRAGSWNQNTLCLQTQCPPWHAPKGVPWRYPPLGYPTYQAFVSSPFLSPPSKDPSTCVSPCFPLGTPSGTH